MIRYIGGFPSQTVKRAEADGQVHAHLSIVAVREKN